MVYQQKLGFRSRKESGRVTYGLSEQTSSVTMKIEIELRVKEELYKYGNPQLLIPVWRPGRPDCWGNTFIIL